MATKKPLAMYNGKVKELQSGDDVGYKKVITRYKAARESVTSSTTLQDDDDFIFPVEANKTYVITANLTGSSANVSGGFKWIFSVPSGASGRVNINRAGATDFGGADVDMTTGGGATTNINTTQTITVRGYIIISSTSGNVVFQWAQHSSFATQTYLERGSIMMLTEV